MPHKNIFFLPNISAALPNGTKNTAIDSKYPVEIQLNVAAFMPNSRPIDGRATVIEEIRNGGSKADTMMVISTDCLEMFLYSPDTRRTPPYVTLKQQVFAPSTLFIASLEAYV